MKCHLIEGAAGCAYALEHQGVAVVVDALRASATVACLLAGGASEVIVVKEVEGALAARKRYPEALLAGERGGLPPDRFDLGNCPRLIGDVAGRRIIFTTTTGAGRLVACWGAHAVYLGTTVNATAVAQAAASHGHDVVLIPAGLMTDPVFDAQEDWVAAAAIAGILDLPIGEGAEPYAKWRRRVESEGIPSLFQNAPHAEKLRRVGLADDIAFCAQLDTVPVVPKALDQNDFGIIVRKPVTISPSLP